jgi:hypothetical protein
MGISLNETIDAKPFHVERDRSKLMDGVLCRADYEIMPLNITNANNRRYSLAVAERVLNDPNIKQRLERRQLIGSMEHPESTALRLDMGASHIVSNMWLKEDKSVLCQSFDVLDTPAGKIIDCLYRAGSLVGASLRAEGSLVEAVDESTGEKFMSVSPTDYNYVVTDYTGDSSFVNAIPMKIERELITNIKSGMESKSNPISAKYAVSLLEHMKSSAAVALMESIKETQTVKVSAVGGVDVISDKQNVVVSAEGDVTVNTDSATDISPTEVMPVAGEVAPEITPEINPVVPAEVTPGIVAPEGTPEHEAAETPEEEAGEHLEKSEEEKEEEKKALESKIKVKESKLIFENFDAMVKFLEQEIAKGDSKLTKVVKLSESKILSDSQKQVVELKVRVAEAIAERDKASEMLAEASSKLDKVTKNYFTENKSRTKVENSYKDLSGVNEKVVKELKDITAKLTVSEAKVVELHKLNAKLIADNKNILDSKQKALIKKYVEGKVRDSSLVLPSNALTLLEQCASETEVDTLLERYRVELCEASLHFGAFPQSITESSSEAVSGEQSGMLSMLDGVLHHLHGVA